MAYALGCPPRRPIARTIQKSVSSAARNTAMKTTLDLNDALLAKAKALAARQRTTLTRLIEEGLQMRLRAQRGRARAVRLPVHRGKGGLAPGLDGLSNKAMLDAADEAPAR
jgi:predicted DNA-binding ribbon-helix-helix protein